MSSQGKLGPVDVKANVQSGRGQYPSVLSNGGGNGACVVYILFIIAFYGRFPIATKVAKGLSNEVDSNGCLAHQNLAAFATLTLT